MSPVMFIHIAMGAISVFAGAAALSLTKGSRLHRLTGNIFFISMVMMAAASIYLAIVLPMAISILVGVFTIYLVTTSWMAARRTNGSVNLLDYCGILIALGVAVGGLIFGLQAHHAPTGLKDGLPALPHFFFSGLALLALAGDAVMLMRRGISGKNRIARHLWRMCFAYFISAGSLFTGPGATAFPQAVRESGILNIPEPLILLIMFFWIIRVLATKWYGDKPAAPPKIS